MDLFFAALASLFAGFIDSIVGGGGLIMVPALFAIFPNAPPATLFGTNKSASIWGTTLASWQYSRRVQIRWRILMPAMGLSFASAFFGAWLVTQISAEFLRQLLPCILFVVLIYTLIKKEMGSIHAPFLPRHKEILVMGVIGVFIGFYDGFFGPGTGSFLVFLFVRCLGYDFLNASASAKVINIATNLAAIILFAFKGHIWWHFMVVLALFNMLGSFLGSYMALKHGTGFVRIMFIFVVCLLIIKTSYDAFLR